MDVRRILERKKLARLRYNVFVLYGKKRGKKYFESFSKRAHLQQNKNSLKLHTFHALIPIKNVLGIRLRMKMHFCPMAIGNCQNLSLKKKIS